jgi:hypothetical protein
LHAALIERLSLRELAGVVVDIGQHVQRRGYIGVILAEFGLANLQTAKSERLGLTVLGHEQVHARELTEGAADVGMVLAELSFANLQAALEIGFRPRIQAQALAEETHPVQGVGGFGVFLSVERLRCRQDLLEDRQCVGILAGLFKRSNAVPLTPQFGR